MGSRCGMLDKLLLVKNGHFLRRNMRKELITEDELLTQLRLQGLDELSDVAEAFMEGDGSITIIRKEGE